MNERGRESCMSPWIHSLGFLLKSQSRAFHYNTIFTSVTSWYTHTHTHTHTHTYQFSSVAQSCPTLCDPMDCSKWGFPIHHQLLKPAQTHVYRVGDTIQPSHPLLSPCPPAFNLSQHQSPFQWVSFSHQVANVLEFQIQHQSFKWIFRTDFL